MDCARAAELYRAAAEQGLTVAQNNLGLMYERGVGCEVDEAEALNYFLRAVEQKCADAQWRLGKAYENAELGVTKNMDEAFRCYSLAAEQGNHAAEYALCVMYVQGEPVEWNPCLAAEWCRKAPRAAMRKRSAGCPAKRWPPPA